MAMVKKSITITVQQNDWIKARIATGYYGNESEVLRELIREKQIQEQETPAEIEAIRAKLIEGEKSGFINKNRDEILAEFKGRLMSKYSPLRDWLFSLSKSRVTATFEEIDNLVNGLPMSARKHPEWWANENVEITTHSHCKSWQAAGYKATADLNLEKVTFIRD